MQTINIPDTDPQKLSIKVSDTFYGGEWIKGLMLRNMCMKHPGCASV